MFALFNSLTATRNACLSEPASSGNLADVALAFDRLNGFAAGTRVATSLGWRTVEALSAGDHVMTFDNGPRAIVAVTRGTHFISADTLPEFACPISVPAEVLGNSEPMLLLPEQTIMLESDVAEELTGDPFALIVARDLIGFRGIERTLGLRPIDIITLHFEADEIVFAEGGALVMAPAPVPGEMSLDFLADEAPMAPPYSVFKGEKARDLIAALVKEDARTFGAAAYAAAA